MILSINPTPEDVIVALDIDGVVSPAVIPYALPNLRKQTPGLHWEIRVDESGESLVAREVLDLLADLGAAEHVDARWNSSWWTSSTAWNDASGTAHWPMLASEDEYLGRVDDPLAPVDWKLMPVLRHVQSDDPRRLVFVDDEMEFSLSRTNERDRRLILSDRRVVLMESRTEAGLLPNQIRRLRETVGL